MTWMTPYDKLDDLQRRIIEDQLRTKCLTLIQGPAGSGKTVILVNILLRLIKNNQVCMVLCTHSLIDMMKSGISSELANEALICTAPAFQKNYSQRQWDVIIIDEVQDISPFLLDKVFRLSNQVILAGDAAQAIYNDGCRIDYFDHIQNLYKPILKTVYRLPKSIQRIAYYFADDPENFIRYEVSKRIASVSVELKHYPDHQREAEGVWLRAKEFAWIKNSTAVIFPKNDDLVSFCNIVLRIENKTPWNICYDRFRNIDYNSLNSYLHKYDIQLQVIGNGAGSMKEADAENLVSAMTYHNAKGLDFEAVFVPKLTKTTVIWNKPDIARRMFFVALTRSRRNLFLSYYGDAHEFVERIPKNLLSFQEFSESPSDEINASDPGEVWF